MKGNESTRVVVEVAATWEMEVTSSGARITKSVERTPFYLNVGNDLLFQREEFVSIANVPRFSPACTATRPSSSGILAWKPSSHALSFFL